MTQVRWKQLHSVKARDLTEGQFVLFPASNPEVLVYVGDNGYYNLRRLSDNAEMYIHPWQEVILLEKVVEDNAPTTYKVFHYCVAVAIFVACFYFGYVVVSTLFGVP